MSKINVPDFFTINSEDFRRSFGGALEYSGQPVQISQKISIETSGKGPASAWVNFAKAGDIFFIYCKRGVGCDWRGYPLSRTLKTRGIYAVAKSISAPYNISNGDIAIDVKIIALLENPVPQYTINGNPKTYWATPYAGNRNDAIQRHPDDTNGYLYPHPKQGLLFVKMIVKNNKNIKPTLLKNWPYFVGKI